MVAYDAPPGMVLPRRHSRRPVAGSITRDPLEDLLEEEPWHIPLYIVGLMGFTLGGLAIVATGAAALMYWWNKTFALLTSAR